MNAVLVATNAKPSLKYALRGLVHHDYPTVVTVGTRPIWSATRHVEHTTSAQSKFARIAEAYRAALDQLPERFIVMDDDMLCLAPGPIPVGHAGTIADHIERAHKHWAASLTLTAKILADLGHGDAPSRELHIPFEVEREPFAEVLDLVLSHGPVVPQWRTLYGALHPTTDLAEIDDIKVEAKHEGQVEPFLDRPWISTNASSWPWVRPRLRALYPDRSPYEVDL